jgi:hypothetical protein
MLKDIIKISRANKIFYKDGFFFFEKNKVSYSDFILFINQRKFTHGIEKSIIKSKNELFKILN